MSVPSDSLPTAERETNGMRRTPAEAGVRGSLWRQAGAGMIAAAVAWLVLLLWYPFFDSGLTFALGQVPSDEQLALFARYRWQNSVAVFAIFGAVLGAALALARGWRRSTVVAGFSGAIFGALFGGLAGWGVLPLSDWSFASLIDPQKPYAETAKWTIVHAAAWMTIGLGVGLGYSLPESSWRNVGRKTLGAVLGGLLAAPCFQFLMTLIELAWPMGGTEVLIPEGSVGRLIWFASAALLIGLMSAAVDAPSSKQG